MNHIFPRIPPTTLIVYSVPLQHYQYLRLALQISLRKYQSFQQNLREMEMPNDQIIQQPPDNQPIIKVENSIQSKSTIRRQKFQKNMAEQQQEKVQHKKSEVFEAERVQKSHEESDFNAPLPPKKYQINQKPLDGTETNNKNSKKKSELKRRFRMMEDIGTDEIRVKPKRKQLSYLITANIRYGIERGELNRKMEGLLERRVYTQTKDKTSCRRSRQLAYLFS